MEYMMENRHSDGKFDGKFTMKFTVMESLMESGLRIFFWWNLWWKMDLDYIFDGMFDGKNFKILETESFSDGIYDDKTHRKCYRWNLFDRNRPVVMKKDKN